MLHRICLAAALSAFCVQAFAADIAKPDQSKQASFHVNNLFTVKVPKGAKLVRVWFAVPQEDAYSVTRNLNVTSDFPVRYERDSQSNKVGFVEVKNPSQDQVTVKEEFDLTRTEERHQINPADTRPLTDQERAALSAYLKATTYVVLNDRMKKLADSIVGTETNPVIAAHKIYDWTYKNINYWVKDPEHLKASPVGSSEYCLSSKTGNCSDFHSLFSSLAMSQGIPTRIVYGSVFKPSLNGTATDGSYHCWIEFFAPRLGWLPSDPSMANIYAEEIQLNDKNRKLVQLSTPFGYNGADKDKVDYYFGNLDDRRVVWSTGRDLMMNPAQEDGPVNSLIKMYVEIDGKQSTDWTRLFTYKEI